MAHLTTSLSSMLILTLLVILQLCTIKPVNAAPASTREFGMVVSTSASPARASGSAASNSGRVFGQQPGVPTPSPSASCSFWLGDVRHQGVAAFNANPGTYQVFRNVKDFGAKGDGTTDDTTAIQNAIAAGNRCAPGSCSSSTTTPAIVYFPAGTYIISKPIVPYYYTQMIGNANCLPVIKPSTGFTGGSWIIDADPYLPSGAQAYGSTNIFWRQIRNFVIDFSNIDINSDLAGIHWPTGQATSIQNVVFNMKQGSNQAGVFIENGSGGFVGDLTFNGGKYGLNVGNQQFTMRGLTFNNVQVAINQIWDWGWTYQGITINNCGTGILMNGRNADTGLQLVGSLTLLDSSITNTPIGISLTWGDTPNDPSYVSGSSVIIENVQLSNVPVAVKDQTGTVLPGTTSSTTIAAWGQGNTYLPTGPNVLRGPFTPAPRSANTLKGGSNYYTRSKPQYVTIPAANLLNVRSYGARGDGVTDDTAAVQAAINAAHTRGQVLFFDHGDYKVTSTIYIPGNTRIVGEAYPVILSSGAFFNDINNPQPVVKVGNTGETGFVELSDLIVSGQGAQAGAIFIQWNLVSNAQFPSGMWDVHTRVGGFAGSNLQLSQCPKTPGTTATAANLNRNCIAAFASMQITSQAAYLLMENVWLWVADHDVEDPALTQITIYAGRGLLIQSNTGPLWLYGTAVEHHQLYQYSMQGAQNVVAGFIQTETAYYQPNPLADTPFPTRTDYQDPYINTNTAAGTTTNSGWGLAIGNAATNINIYGAGLYSFFTNYDVSCSNVGNGQRCQDRIFLAPSSGKINVYNLNTVGTYNMISQQTVTNGRTGVNDVAQYINNKDGFVNTIAIFRLSS